MTTQVKCNFCGETDDWCDPPFFPNGGKMELYDDSGGNNAEKELDICPNCVNKLKEQYPLVKKACED